MATYTLKLIPGTTAGAITTIVVPAPPKKRLTQYVPRYSAEEISLGSDTPVFPDLEPSGALVSGRRLLADHLLRRITTPRGSIPMLPDYGIDVRELLNDKIDANSLYALRAMIEAELLEDERVSAASVVAEFNRQTETLSFDVTVEIADGPFRFTALITALSIDLLMEA